MSADICVFIPEQLNLYTAFWSLASYWVSFIKSHGLSYWSFSSSILDVVRSGSFLWYSHCSEAVPGCLRHPCFCRIRVHTWSGICSRCADLGTRCLQWLRREVRKRFKQEKKPSQVQTTQDVFHLILIHSCFQTHFLPWRHKSEHLSCLSVTQ